MERNLYRINEGTGSFSLSVNCKFTGADDNQELVNIFPDSLFAKKIKGMFWCINAVGFVELAWENSEHPIVILSGNGKWDLSGGNEFFVPDESNGMITATTHGFDDLDSYTIIISGQK